MRVPGHLLRAGRVLACSLRPGARTHGGAPPIGLARYAPPGSVGAQRLLRPRSYARHAQRPRPGTMHGSGGHLRRAGACLRSVEPRPGGTQRWTHGDPVAARAGTVSACPRAGTYRPAARAASGACASLARRARQPHVWHRSTWHATRDASERRSMILSPAWITLYICLKTGW